MIRLGLRSQDKTSIRFEFGNDEKDDRIIIREGESFTLALVDYFYDTMFLNAKDLYKLLKNCDDFNYEVVGGHLLIKADLR